MDNTLLQPDRDMAEDDIDEILGEEEEFIASLEEEMLPLNSETLECLRAKWIVMLKERYQEQLEAVERDRKQNNHYKTPRKVSSFFNVKPGVCTSDKHRKRSRLMKRTIRFTMYFIQTLTSLSPLA